MSAPDSAPIQNYVEAAIAGSHADGCIVIASEQSEANLRFANNALTTNGEMQSRSVTVISIVSNPGGPAAGSVSRAVTTDA